MRAEPTQSYDQSATAYCGCWVSGGHFKGVAAQGHDW